MVKRRIQPLPHAKQVRRKSPDDALQSSTVAVRAPCRRMLEALRCPALVNGPCQTNKIQQLGKEIERTFWNATGSAYDQGCWEGARLPALRKPFPGYKPACARSRATQPHLKEPASPRPGQRPEYVKGVAGYDWSGNNWLGG